MLLGYVMLQKMQWYWSLGQISIIVALLSAHALVYFLITGFQIVLSLNNRARKKKKKTLTQQAFTVDRNEPQYNLIQTYFTLGIKIIPVVSKLATDPPS